MNTKIYKSKEDFLKRKNKEENGVSEDFAKRNHDYVIDNESNNGCWNCNACDRCNDCNVCSDCDYCNYCDVCSDCNDCNYCNDCNDCSDCCDCCFCNYCNDCSDCSDCNDCIRCNDCNYCNDCDDCSGCDACDRCNDCNVCSDCDYFFKGELKHKVPKIKNIHSEILAATRKEGALNMVAWHTCETTHCRAGWVVHLAGEEGLELERETSTSFAATMIYKESSNIKVSPSKFHESEESAMADIKRCADLERKEMQQ